MPGRACRGGFAGKDQDLNLAAITIIFLRIPGHRRRRPEAFGRRSREGGACARASHARVREASGSPSVLTMKDCPSDGLDAGRMKAAKAVGSRERMLLSVPGSMVPKPKIAAVERRKACALTLERALPRVSKRGGG